MEPLVSVGIPIYNGAEFLRTALDAVCGQTYRNLEIVISDNASRDETAAICQEYMRRDPRIRYFRQPHTIRPADNHMFVFEQSTGEYFRWATHDDCCDPTYIARCVEVLESDPSVVVAYTKARVIDPAGAVICQYDFSLETDASKVWDRFGAIIRADHRKYSCLEIYGVIRSKLLRSVPPMGNYVSADRVMLARLLLLGRFFRAPEVLFCSREHDSRSCRVIPVRISSARTQWRRWVGTGPLPALEWWDPSKKGVINFPEWRVLREYTRSITDAPLTGHAKVRCMLEIARYAIGNVPKLGRDLILAAEQLTVRPPEEQAVNSVQQ